MTTQIEGFTGFGLSASSGPPLLICFSHLRWDFVFQRPQHLMTRFARTHARGVLGRAELRECGHGARRRARLRPTTCVTVVTPQLPEGCA